MYHTSHNIDPASFGYTSSIQFHPSPLGLAKGQSYIEYVDATFVNKESLEKTLDDDQALAEDQDGRIQPRTPPLEYVQERKLRQECKCE